MVQTLLLDGDGIFQDDNGPIHTAHVVKNCYEAHESELERMESPPQSPDLNILSMNEYKAIYHKTIRETTRSSSIQYAIVQINAASTACTACGSRT